MSRNPLQKPYDGPYRVIKAGDKTFKMQIGDREETVTVDRLKPGYFDETQSIPLVVLKRRGRPPKKILAKNELVPNVLPKRRGHPPKKKTNLT